MYATIVYNGKIKKLWQTIEASFLGAGKSEKTFSNFARVLM